MSLHTRMLIQNLKNLGLKPTFKEGDEMEDGEISFPNSDIHIQVGNIMGGYFILNQELYKKGKMYGIKNIGEKEIYDTQELSAFIKQIELLLKGENKHYEAKKSRFTQPLLN